MTETADLRRQFVETLLGTIETMNHPSPALMDRIEAELPDRESAERYFRALLEKVSVRFPSGDHLDRVETLLARLG